MRTIFPFFLQKKVHYIIHYSGILSQRHRYSRLTHTHAQTNSWHTQTRQAACSRCRHNSRYDNRRKIIPKKPLKRGQSEYGSAEEVERERERENKIQLCQYAHRLKTKNKKKVKTVHLISCLYNLLWPKNQKTTCTFPEHTVCSS